MFVSFHFCDLDLQKMHEAFGSCCHRFFVVALAIVSRPAKSDPCPSSVCPGMAGEEGSTGAIKRRTLFCYPADPFFHHCTVSVLCRAEPTANSGMEASHFLLKKEMIKIIE